MDERLVHQVQEGDQEAFRSLVITEHARLLRVAQGVLRDPHVAEDAVQQAFLDIWRDIRRLRDASKFEGWSYRLLLRLCYAEAKHMVPQPFLDFDRQPRDTVQRAFIGEGGYDGLIACAEDTWEPEASESSLRFEGFVIADELPADPVPWYPSE